MAGLTADNPISMFEAMSSARVIPGDTIYLRAGTYKWDWQCKLLGSAELPITIRPYPGERAIIDGSMSIPSGNYGYLRFIEIEFSNSYGYRGTWSDAPFNRQVGVDAFGSYPVDLINCIVHDTGVAIGHWSGATNSVIYGNLTYDYGWADSARPAPDGHGHALYCQNQSETGTKTIKHNIFARGFGGTLRLYGSEAGYSKNMTVEECVHIGQNALIGGQGEYTGFTIEDCHNYNSPINLGYTYMQNGTIICRRNRVYSNTPRAISCQGWLTPTIADNLFVGDGNDTGAPGCVCYHKYTTNRTGEAIDYSGNAYHWTNSDSSSPFGIDGVGFYTLAQWQALGYDADSAFTTSLPSTNETFVYANEYLDADAKRMGIFVVWNWQGLDTVNIDLSALNLANGTTYTMHNAQNYFGDTVQFVADGNPLAVDMRAASHSLSVPVGWHDPLDSKTFPRFGAFVVTR